MRILGIISSAFSGLAQKIYTWSNTFSSSIIGTSQNLSGYHASASTNKYVFIANTSDVNRKSTISSSNLGTTQNAIFNSTHPAGSVVSNGSILMVACGNDTTRSQRLLHTVTTSDAWTTLTDTSAPSFDRKGGIWDTINNRFIFCSNTSSNGRITLVTGSGNTWTPATTSITTPANTRMNDIGFNQSSTSPLYIVVPISSTTSIYSNDGSNFSTWTTRTVTGTNRVWRSIAYGNGIWVLIGAQTTFVTSTDGINWTERSWGLGPVRPDNNTQIRFINDRFVTVLRSSSSPYSFYIATSFNGIDWTTEILTRTDLTAAFSWDYSTHEDAIFASTSDVADSLDGSAFIVRGI